MADSSSSFSIEEALKAVRERVKAAGNVAVPQIKGAPKDDDDLNDNGEMMVWSCNLVYGELLTHSVVKLVDLALSAVDTARLQKSDTSQPRTSQRATFIDLGSGEGAPVCIAAAAFPRAWSRLTGIELVPRLHRLAEAHHAGLMEDAAVAGHIDVIKVLERANFECDDMLKKGVSWPGETDVVFLNGTCYDIETLEALFKAIEGLVPGAVVILTSHKIPADSGAGKLFELLHEGTYDATWGDVTARIYRRKQLPKWIGGIKI